MKTYGKRMKRQTTLWEKIFANDVCNKGIVFQIYKELSKFNHKNTIPLEDVQNT